jgi:acetyl-CoA C-acetyltransferase
MLNRVQLGWFMAQPVYILGGYQSDFASNWQRNGIELFDGFRDTVLHGLQATSLDPRDIEVAHVGNFTAELFCGQGHLGGFFAATHPAFAQLPAARHEAACASGSIAALAASAEIEAGRYDLAAVIGIEVMRNVPGDQAAAYIGGTAMWNGHECTDVRYPWPHLFSALGDEYERRYGLRYEHLAHIAENNFANARRNPNAQTRRWSFNAQSFTEDDAANPVIEGRIRKHDCGQLTDGAAVIFLASANRAQQYARQRGISLDDVPHIQGWGHRTAPIAYQPKIDASRDQAYVFPHVRATIQDAFQRAGIRSVDDLDGIETHDCFTTTEYMAIDHFGITAPGASWQAIEGGDIEMGGRIPVNASGGLIGLGHPVGATGVRMLLDSYKQCTNSAGSYQIGAARRVATLNIGGSATTVVSFVVGR